MVVFRTLSLFLFLSVASLIHAHLILEEPPENFSPVVEVAGCFVQVEDKMLFLKHKSSSYGSVWGLPGGKLEEGETPLAAIIRETKEETGITLSKNDIVHLKKFYVRHPHADFIFHVFVQTLQQFPQNIVLNPSEHVEYRWMSLQSALKEPLIPGSEECFKMCFGENL